MLYTIDFGMLVAGQLVLLIVCLSMVPSAMMLLPLMHWTQLTTKLIGVSLGTLPAAFIAVHPAVFPTHFLLSAENPSSTSTIYRSGKNPYPIDKNDPKKGTKKDYSFLKCISNCKSDCELPTDGLATQRVVRKLLCMTSNVIISS